MITNKCIYFGKCGGCQIQGLEFDRYCCEKIENLKNLISDVNYQKLNSLETFDTSIRRRVIFKIDYGCNIGFFKEKTNDVVSIVKCKLLMDEINNLILPLRKLFKSFVKRNDGEILITSVENGITIDFINIKLMVLDIAKIKNFAEQYNIIRITSDNNEIYKKDEPFVVFNNVKIHYPAKTFLQPSKISENKIVELVLNYIKNDKYNKIADLFCGLGLFSFYIKDFANEVFSIDCDDNAIHQLKKTAHSYHFNINAKTIDLFKHPISSDKLNDFDVVIIDPPRDGAYNQIKELAKSNVKKIIYVSCNPLTFKKDAKFLIDNGYTLQEITPVDQFQNTKHLELVSIFIK